MGSAIEGAEPRGSASDTHDYTGEVGIDAGEALEHLLPGLAPRGDGLRGLGFQQRAGTPEVSRRYRLPCIPK